MHELRTFSGRRALAAGIDGHEPGEGPSRHEAVGGDETDVGEERGLLGRRRGDHHALASHRRAGSLDRPDERVAEPLTATRPLDTPSLDDELPADETTEGLGDEITAFSPDDGDRLAAGDRRRRGDGVWDIWAGNA